MCTQPNAIEALREAEAALELAIQRILKRDPGHHTEVTSEAKALVSVRQALQGCAPEAQSPESKQPQKFTGDSEMRRAFEIEYGQNWTDPDWRRETSIWAAAWHKATAAAQQGVQPVAWLAEYQDREGNSKWYVTTHKDLAAENDMHGAPKPLYTHPVAQGLEQFIEQAGDVHFQRCRLGSIKGPIRWDVSFGHHGIEVRGKTLQEAIAKALAAQAKQAEAMEVSRSGGCGCCSNACADRSDGCRHVNENPSAADMREKVNRYCGCGMCLETDKEHEPSCHRSVSQAKKGGGAA